MASMRRRQPMRLFRWQGQGWTHGRKGLVRLPHCAHGRQAQGQAALGPHLRRRRPMGGMHAPALVWRLGGVPVRCPAGRATAK